MARDLNGTSSDHLQGSTGGFSISTPFFVAVRAWLDVDTAYQCAMEMRDDGAADQPRIVLEHDDPANSLRAFVKLNNSNQVSGGLVSLPTGQWNLLGGLFEASQVRAQVNTTVGTAGSIGFAYPAIDTMTLGWLVSFGGGSYWNGRLAWAAVWDHIPAADIRARLVSATPDFYPKGLLHYWPITGRHSPERDLAGGYNMTVTGTTQIENPRLVLPARRFMPGLDAPAPAAGSLLRHPGMSGGMQDLSGGMAA